MDNQRSTVAVTLKWGETVKDMSERRKKSIFSTPKSLQILSPAITQNKTPDSCTVTEERLKTDFTKLSSKLRHK